MATLLSLAFPGGGLFYLGHPFLATFDLLGEVVLFLVWVSMLTGSTTDTLGVAIGTGVFLFVLTKVHSVRLGRMLGARSIPESEGRRERARKLAMAGAALSALLVIAAFPLTAGARPRLDRDLDASTEDGTWKVSRDASEWGVHKDDASARSQWTHVPTGAHVTVFAHPQGLLDGQEQFHRDYAQEMKNRDFTPVLDDGKVPMFDGFRYVGEKKAPNGQVVAFVAYFLYDPDHHDIHQVSLAVPHEDTQAAEAVIEDFLHHAKFVDPIPPKR